MEKEIFVEGIYMERPGKHSSKGYLDRQKTKASQEAGGSERRKLGAAEEPGDAKWLWSRHGDKSVFVTEEKKGRAGQGRASK